MNTTNQRGFIGMVLLIVVVLITLGFFGLSAEKIINSTVVGDNLEYGWNLAVNFFDRFIIAPAIFVWKNAFSTVWDAAVLQLSNIWAAFLK